uniref:Serine/threonine-protein phosphatase 2A 55 kDa regulatory subunit B n=1 Tax=Rhizophora mucronata TaxID=61149 RepID=A0A2P2LHW3_RHIMU
MRQSALCDHGARLLQDAEYHGSKSFFTEIITSISHLKFTNDGRHILSRDYMSLKVFDLELVMCFALKQSYEDSLAYFL